MFLKIQAKFVEVHPKSKVPAPRPTPGPAPPAFAIRTAAFPQACDGYVESPKDQ